MLWVSVHIFFQQGESYSFTRLQGTVFVLFPLREVGGFLRVEFGPDCILNRGKEGNMHSFSLRVHSVLDPHQPLVSRKTQP